MSESRPQSRSGEEKLLERFMSEYRAQGPLTLARRIENVFSFLYATKPEDSCHFDRDLLDQIKAAALKGAAASEKQTNTPEGWKLVPVEATNEMQWAANDYSTATESKPKGMWWWNRLYQAMLAAAPEAPK